MSDTTDVIRGTLKLDTFQEGRVYSNVDDLIQSLADIFAIEIPTTVTNVIVSSEEPGDDFKTGVWVRRNTAGTFSGIYLFQAGAWTKVFPEAVTIGESAAVGVNSGLWVETDAVGSFEALYAYQSGSWQQIYPDPSPPDYAAIFATYYRSTIWGGEGVNAGSDNYYVTTVPAIDALTIPTTISFIPDSDNTGPSTLNVNLLGNVPIIDSSGSALSGGELQADVITEVTYDGTAWVVSLPADISGAYIIDNTITTLKLADSAISTDKIANVAVTAAKVATAAISDAKIAPSAVITSKIADAAVTEAKLAAGAIGEAKIADSAVTTNKINNLAVTEAKLGVGAVTGTKIGAGAVSAAKMAADSVATATIVDAAVDEDKLAASVAGDGLAGGAGTALSVNVDSSTIEINADTLRVKDAGIVTAKIANLNVTEGKLAAGAVTETKIGNNAVTAAKIAAAVAGNGLAGGGGSALSVNVDSSTIEIASDILRVKASGITASQLASNSVDSAEIVAGAVDNSHTNFAWSYISPSVAYYDSTPLAFIPETRDLRYMILGKLLIITFYIEDTTPNPWSSGENGLRLTGVNIAGTPIHPQPAGCARYTLGESSPCWYDAGLNIIYIPYETVAGNNFPSSLIWTCQGTIIAALS
jgi:hypothetical protein